MSDIRHLVSGGKESNRIGEGRIDKMETDRFNSIVERISGVNPSKLASLVTKEEVQTNFGPQSRAMTEQRGQGPGPKLGSALPWAADPVDKGTGGNGSSDGSLVQNLANKVAMLEQRLAKYEVWNGNDNDPVMTTSQKSKGPSNRGPDSNAFARDIDPKKAKTKDPVDGKPDKPLKNNPEAQMAGEHKNILGISMAEWRDMAGLKAPPVDLTVRAPINESYEDEDEGAQVQAPSVSPDQASVVEAQLWADFLRLYDSTPEDFAAFVEAAHNSQDGDALMAIQDLEEEFVESLDRYLQGETSAKETIDQFVSRGGDSQEEDIDVLWSQWLEARGLTVEMFNNLAEAARTEDDMNCLEQLQDMFEAEVAAKRVAGGSPVPSGESEIRQPGKAPVKTVSLARGDIKPSRKGNFSLPAAMRAKMGLPKEEENDMDEEDAFECDADEGGGPDMKHPGWAKAMKRFKVRRKS